MIIPENDSDLYFIVKNVLIMKVNDILAFKAIINVLNIYDICTT